MTEKDYFKYFFPFFSKFLEQYRKDAPTYVIIVYGWIEAQLTKLLIDYFVDSSKGEPVEKYHSAEKIDIAHKLGIISDDCLRDLKAVKTIRNRYAHCKVTINNDTVMFHHNEDSVKALATNLVRQFKIFLDKYKEYRPSFPNGKIGEVAMITVAIFIELCFSKRMEFQHLKNPDKEKFYIE